MFHGLFVDWIIIFKYLICKDGMKIYLDVCCLNRPFDDQRHDRIRLETEAIFTILKFVELDKLELFDSDIILYEVEKIPDLKRKNNPKLNII